MESLRENHEVLTTEREPEGQAQRSKSNKIPTKSHISRKNILFNSFNLLIDNKLRINLIVLILV